LVLDSSSVTITAPNGNSVLFKIQPYKSLSSPYVYYWFWNGLDNHGDTVSTADYSVLVSLLEIGASIRKTTTQNVHVWGTSLSVLFRNSAIDVKESQQSTLSYDILGRLLHPEPSSNRVRLVLQQNQNATWNTCIPINLTAINRKGSHPKD
jgi:hypothetical protein